MAVANSRIDFQGRVAIVTGAGGALGGEYCRLLAARGAAVVVNDLGGSTTGEAHPATTPTAWCKTFARAAGGRSPITTRWQPWSPAARPWYAPPSTSFGRIDIVVNNAGNQRNVRFGELTELDIESVLAVHLKGAFFVTQPAYRHMVQQGYGRIILVSSQSGIFGNPIRSNYGAAKTAMIGLMNVIAQEAPPGVIVNCLFPNAVGGRLGGKPGDARPDSEFLAAAGSKVQHYIAGMQSSFVAALMAYLASEQCTRSQNMYSVLGGKYSRIFVGLTCGWFQPGSTPPAPEDILQHLPQIDDRSHYDVPLSGLDEMDTVSL